MGESLHSVTGLEELEEKRREEMLDAVGFKMCAHTKECDVDMLLARDGFKINSERAYYTALPNTRSHRSVGTRSASISQPAIVGPTVSLNSSVICPKGKLCPK